MWPSGHKMSRLDESICKINLINLKKVLMQKHVS